MGIKHSTWGLVGIAAVVATLAMPARAQEQVAVRAEPTRIEQGIDGKRPYDSRLNELIDSIRGIDGKVERGNYQEVIDEYGDTVGRILEYDLQPLADGDLGNGELSQERKKALGVILNNYAIAYENTGGNVPTTIKFYELSIQLDPTRHTPYSNLAGVFYRRLQNYQRAKALWEKALEINPNFTLAKIKIAKCNEHLKH